MSSKQAERRHNDELDKILSLLELRCVKPEPVQDVVVEEEAEDDEEVPEAPPSLASELLDEVETVKEEEVDVIIRINFPTPSLKQVISERMRQIQRDNRIYTLPIMFNSVIAPEKIPIISKLSPRLYIDALAELTGCQRYRSSLAEYWFLDTLADLLRRAQDDEFDPEAQAVLILWFCEWMKEMETFDAADRTRMLDRFKEIMMCAAHFIVTEDRLPDPVEADVTYKEHEIIIDPNADVESQNSEELLFTGDMNAYKCSLGNLTKIIHYIYDLFSTDYQYDLVRSVFTFTPDYHIRDATHQMRIPKKFYAPLKPVKHKEKPAKKPPAKDKSKKAQKQEPDPPEYLALMALKEKEQEELKAKEQMEREEWNRRQSVLPLMHAIEEGFLDKYWPSPEPEPEPEPVPPPPPRKKRN